MTRQKQRSQCVEIRAARLLGRRLGRRCVLPQGSARGPAARSRAPPEDLAMSQTAGFRVTPTCRRTSRLTWTPGCYVAQVTAGGPVFFLTAEAAPVRVAATFNAQMVHGGVRRDDHVPRWNRHRSDVGNVRAIQRFSGHGRSGHREDRRLSGSESAIPGGALAGKAGATGDDNGDRARGRARHRRAPGGGTDRGGDDDAVEQYAPGAPIAHARTKASRRFCGYLSQAGFGAIAKFQAGPLSTDYVTNHANAWRNSGAAALVSRWRVRRAGAIG